MKQPVCPLCEERKLEHTFRNRLACLRCDELLFDLEMECEPEGLSESAETAPWPRAA